MFKVRVFITSVFVCFCLFANAQFEKGKYTLGLGQSMTIQQSSNYTGFVLHRTNIEGGYFFKNRWELGLSGDFAFTGNLNVRREYLTNRNYSLSAYSRYYFSNKKFTPYAEAFVGGGALEGRFIEPTDEIDNYKPYLRVGLGIGASYKINKRLTVNAGLRYDINKHFEKFEINRDRLNLNVGMKYSF